MGAVDEGVGVAPVLRIGQLLKAAITGKVIRRQMDGRMALAVALQDLKTAGVECICQNV